MADIDEVSRSIPVHILEVNNGGEFFAMPIASGPNEDAYSIFLANLNNHLNDSRDTTKITSQHNFKHGEIVGVYCKAQKDDAERLWYRGRVLAKFKNVSGVTVKVLLVDCGTTTFVSGTWMRKLESSYQDFPIQVMMCHFYGLKPVTYNATFDSLVEKQVCRKWDSSAKVRLQELLKDSLGRIYVKSVDNDGHFNVILKISNFDRGGQQTDINVNDLLVAEDYAIFEEHADLLPESAFADDEAASIVSDASPKDKCARQNALSPAELESLMERKKMEEIRFNLGIDYLLDEYRDALGLPRLEPEDTGKQEDAAADERESSVVNTARAMPASCDDGVEFMDYGSVMNDECFSQRRAAKPEATMNKLMDKEPPSSPLTTCSRVTGSMPFDEPLSERLAKNDQSTDQRFDVIKKTVSSSKQATGNKKDIWSRLKDQKSEGQSSSLSESDFEVRPRKAAATANDNCQSSGSLQAADYTNGVLPSSKSIDRPRRTADNQKSRYERECLKQQLKNRGDDDTFQYRDSSWNFLKAIGVGEAMKTKWKHGNGNVSSGGRCDENEAMPSIYSDVLVSGDIKPKCILSVEKLDVPNEIRYTLNSGCHKTLITKPTPLQSYVWPAVARGRHVVGLDRVKSGKMLAYLLPVLTQLVDAPLSYKDLPRGTGPIVLILTTDWNKANKICKASEKILYSYRTKFRSKVLYGGRGKFEEEMVSLINGCEVLVSTLPSLLTMIEKRCTNLERLCHLVFDDAHILVENFADEIKALMRIYAENLAKMVSLNLPHQLIAMGTEWSRGLESLLNAYFDNALIVIPNKLEASIFKQVKQHVEICASGERIDHVMSFLRGDFADHNVVICVNSAKEADHVASLLESQCIGALKVTEFMSPAELKDVQMNWDYVVKSRKAHECVLVMTDRVATRLAVRNATCIINYEFPVNKIDFGQRLGCLLDSMRNKDETSKNAASVVLLTEECENAAPSLAKLLKRARQHVPPSLISLAQKVERHKEERAKQREICEDLKYLGSCRDIQKCTQRHTIFADSDEPKDIPKYGVVKVKILDVVSANVFWGKIVEHKPPKRGNPSEVYDTKAYFKLAYDMQVFYVIKSNQMRHGLTPEGVLKSDICVIKAEDGFQRVRVESIEKRNAQTAIATVVNVFGLDNGISTRVPVEDLLMLPKDKSFSLENVPQQAIELIVCGIKPVDKSFTWTVEACMKVDKLICGKMLEGKIALALRNTLWLDPLVEKTKYNELHANVTTLHVGAYLLEFSFGDKNRSHVKNLCDLCRDVIELEDATDVENGLLELSSTVLKRSWETVEMPDDDYQDVYVAAVENPCLFYVQLWKNVSMLDKLEDKIEALMKVLPKHEEPNTKDIGRGTICLAQFTIDDKWYRARVLEVNKDNEFHVFYVDHGDIEWVSEKRLWAAWPEILELPCQAIECSLVHISPKETNWNKEDADCLWDLCENNLLVAQVKSKCGSDYSGAYRYNIELYDTTGEATINMSHELVFLGHARGTQDCIQEIFPDALWYPENRKSTNAVDCIPDLCLQIYRCEVASQQLELAEKLRRTISDVQGDEPTLVPGAESVVKLLALCATQEVVSILVDSLNGLMQKNNSLSEKIHNEGGLKTLCSLLSKSESNTLLKKIMSTLHFFTHSKRGQESIGGYGGVKAICEIFIKSNDEKTVFDSLNVLSSVCKDSDLNCERACQAKAMDKIVRFMQDANDVKTLQLCTHIIVVLTKSPRVREDFKDPAILDEIGKLLNEVNDKKCIMNCLEYLTLAINHNQMYRDLIRKRGMLRRIERLLYKPMAEGLAVKRLCSQLLSKLKVNDDMTGSGQQTIQVPRIEATRDQALSASHHLKCLSPRTLWSQQEEKIILAIQLRGVKNEQVTIGERNFFFSCRTDEFKYQLDLEWYDAVNAQLSGWQVCGGEVLIHLAKQKKLDWPRLLLSTVKPPFLHVDFDRCTMDGDDDANAPSKCLPPRKTDVTSCYAGGCFPDMYFSDADSSDDEESKNSDLCDEFGPIT